MVTVTMSIYMVIPSRSFLLSLNCFFCTTPRSTFFMAAAIKRVFDHKGHMLYLRNPEEEPEGETEEEPPKKKRRSNGSAKKKKKPMQIIIRIVEPLVDCNHALRLLASMYKTKRDANANWDSSADEEWLGEVDNIFTKRLYEIGAQRLRELSHRTPGSKAGETGFVEAAIKYEGDEKLDPKRLACPSNKPRVAARKEREGAASHACTYSPPSSFRPRTYHPAPPSLTQSLTHRSLSSSPSTPSISHSTSYFLSITPHARTSGAGESKAPKTPASASAPKTPKPSGDAAGKPAPATSAASAKGDRAGANRKEKNGDTDTELKISQSEQKRLKENSRVEGEQKKKMEENEEREKKEKERAAEIEREMREMKERLIKDRETEEREERKRQEEKERAAEMQREREREEKERQEEKRKEEEREKEKAADGTPRENDENMGVEAGTPAAEAQLDKRTQPGLQPASAAIAPIVVAPLALPPSSAPAPAPDSAPAPAAAQDSAAVAAAAVAAAAAAAAVTVVVAAAADDEEANNASIASATPANDEVGTPRCSLFFFN
jgi:hypothetical protein